MTKNNAFKKSIRTYMDAHNLTYAEARKILDEESYLQGTGAITLIIGGTGTGKTIQFREILKDQTHNTAVILAHKEDLDYVSTTHYVETMPYQYHENGIVNSVDVLQTKNNLQNLVDQKVYSTVAIDGIGYCANQGEKNLLDILPNRVDLVLTFQFHSTKFHTSEEDFIAEALEHLDRMELSRKKLSKRVKTIKHTTLDAYDVSKNREDRFSVTDYYL